MSLQMSSFNKAPLVWVSLAVNVFLVLALSSVWNPFKTGSPPLRSGPIGYHHLVDPREVFKNRPIDLLNASAVFNTVDGAGKQKSANLFPVGVSFIPAYLPANTLMYHSRWTPEIPGAFEWVAMDYEFSYSFASFKRGKKKERHPPPPGKHYPPPDGGAPHAGKAPPEPKWDRNDHPNFLFTFRNTKPLDKLILLDGASAAKTSTGEMDQQLILSRQKENPDHVNEWTAADKICKWGKPFGLQGIVRMEIGYEIILCSFFDNIELVSNVTLFNVTKLGNLPWESPEPKDELEAKRALLVDSWQAMSGYDWLVSGANVNEGEGRILLDFAGMVTPLNSTWIDPDPYQRRISNLTNDQKEGIISHLETYLQTPVNPFEKTNWQLVTGYISDKFGPILVQLNNTFTIYKLESETIDSKQAIENAVGNITRLTYNIARRYVDESAAAEEQRQIALSYAIDDYVHHTFPLTTNAEILIYSSIYKVTHEVLSSLFEVFFETREMLPDLMVSPTDVKFEQFHKTLIAQKDKFQQLLKALSWSLFTQCTKKCGWDEVCYVPTRGPGPLGWGAGDSPYFDYYDNRYRVPQDLRCLSYRDMGS